MLDAEIAAIATAPSRAQNQYVQHHGAASMLSETERAVAEMLRAVPHRVISHTVLRDHLACYRKRRGEEAIDALRRRQTVLEAASVLGLGTLRQGQRNMEFQKAYRTPAIDAELQRLGVLPSSFPELAAARRGEASGEEPAMQPAVNLPQVVAHAWKAEVTLTK